MSALDTPNKGRKKLESIPEYKNKKEFARQEMNQYFKRQVGIIYLGIFGVSVVIRLIKMIFEPLLLRDAAYYLRMAEVWHKTGVYQEIIKEHESIPPLPFWCIKSLMNFCGNSEIAGRSISIFLGGLIPVVGFVLAREITHNIRFSLIAALCFILHPNLVSYSTQPLRENYYILLIGLLLIAMVRNSRETRTTGWIVCGAIIGVAVLCRYEILEFLVFVTMEIAVLELKRNRIIPFLKSVGIFLLVFVITSFSLLVIINCNYSSIYKIKRYYSRAIGAEAEI